MIETRTATGSNTITVRPNPYGPAGDTVLESVDPWYRLLRALADLFLAGEISMQDLQEQQAHWSPLFQSGTNEFTCPAARQLDGFIAFAWMEPSCGCDIYRETPCDHPARTDDDCREDLRQMMGL